MQESIYRKITKVKIIQGKVIRKKCCDNVQEKLENFLSEHDVIDVKQSLCQYSENAGLIVYTVFYNEYSN